MMHYTVVVCPDLGRDGVLPHIIQPPLRHAALTHTYIHTVRFVTPCNEHIMIESRKLSSNYRAYIQYIHIPYYKHKIHRWSRREIKA